MHDDRLGIVALGGSLPLSLARTLAEEGQDFFCVCIDGLTDSKITSYPHSFVKFLRLDALLGALKQNGCKRIVFAGHFFRPKLSKLRFDLGTLRYLPLLTLSRGYGDDAIIRRVTRSFENEGFKVVSLKEVTPQLVAGQGQLGAYPLLEKFNEDIKSGFTILKQLGSHDIGQALVIDKKRVIAVEAAEGTDAMLHRVSELRGTSQYPAPRRSGVLLKVAKPQQQLRDDMPVVGLRTIENAIAAGLEVIAIEAGCVITTDLPEMIALANNQKLAIIGIDSVSSVEI